MSGNDSTPEQAIAVTPAVANTAGPRPAAPPPARTTKGLRVTVAVSPSSGMSLEKEVELVKAALLYADQVTLCSPTTTLLASVSALSTLNQEQRFSFMEEIFPIIRPGSEVAAKEYRRLLTSKRRTPKELIVALRLQHEFDHMWKDLESTAEDLLRKAGAAELEPALRAGLVQLDLLDAGFRRNDMASVFVERLAAYLADPGTYPLFDDSTGRLIAAGRDAGIFVVPRNIERRATEAGLGAGLIAELPTFPAAPMERVLEARGELEGHVARFRSAMGEMRRYLETTAIDEGFRDEVAELYVREVQAAMEEIRAVLKGPPASRTILKGLLAASPAPGIIGLAVFSPAHLPLLVATLLGAAAGGVRAGAALTEERHKREAKAGENDLFFLYRAAQLLG